MIRAAFLIAALALATPAAAQGARESVGFSVGPANFTVPLPAGYCVPKGDDVARVEQATRFLSSANVALALVACGERADPLAILIIAVPKDSRIQVTTLERIFADPVFSNDGGPAATPDKGARGMGHDDVCGYIGTKTYERKTAVSSAGCTTVLRDRLIFVFLSASGDDPATIPRLKRETRAFVLSIRPAD